MEKPVQETETAKTGTAGLSDTWNLKAAHTFLLQILETAPMPAEKQPAALLWKSFKAGESYPTPFLKPSLSQSIYTIYL